MEQIKNQTAYEIPFQVHVKNIIHRQWVPFTEMTLELGSEYKGIVTHHKFQDKKNAGSDMSQI